VTDSRPATREHICKVKSLLVDVAQALLERGRKHDASKLEHPEVETFDVCTDRLRGLTYGSAEYADCLAEMKPALDHHYASNRHHPEHHANGVYDMTLIDLVEMLSDWKAATLRHADGDLARSIAINTKRFGLRPEMVDLLGRTARELGWIK
jgi:hypothetical protein